MNISLKSSLIATATLCIAVSTLAFAGSHEPSKKELKNAMEYRQSTFKMVGQHFGAMTAMVKGKVEYDAEVFAKNADALAMLGQLTPNGFAVEGTHDKSRAKKEIWENKAEFAEVLAEFQTTTAALSEAAKGGELDKAKAAFGDVGKTCKGCHKAFRSKKK